MYSFPYFIRIQPAAQTILDSFIIVVYGVVLLSTIMLQLFQMFRKIYMFEMCNDCCSVLLCLRLSGTNKELTYLGYLLKTYLLARYQ